MGCVAAAALWPPAVAGSVAGQTLTLELLGRDADRVSRADTAAPDGIVDVHFRVKVKFPQPVEIRSIALREAGPGDRATGPGYGTRDSESGLVVVESEGRRLNEGFADRLTAIDREATLDLYLRDNGTLNVGSRVVLEIALEDGGVARRAFTLAPPDGRLLGTWQVHCAPGSAAAFEALTLSGRLWIELDADGRASGEIHGIPLAGSVSGDSIVVAGESAAGRATVRGTLAPRGSRGARPSASGWLEYEPADRRCMGGRWSTE